MEGYLNSPKERNKYNRVIDDAINSAKKFIMAHPDEVSFKQELYGHTFNALPFIIKSTEAAGTKFRFLVSKTYFRENIGEMQAPQEVLDHWDNNKLDINVYLSTATNRLLTPGEPSVSDAVLYLYDQAKADILPVLYDYYIKLFRIHAIHKMSLGFIEYKSKDLCNTVAFGTILGMLWAYELTTKAKPVLAPYMKKAKLREMLETHCPKSSLHARYIIGEINGKKLYKEYTDTAHDSISIYHRELYHCMTEGMHNDEEISREGLQTIACIYVNPQKAEDMAYSMEFFRNIGLIRGDAVKQMGKELKEKESKIDDLLEEIASARKKKNDRQEELSSLKSEISSLNKTIDELQKKLHNQSTNEDLLAENKKLKKELNDKNRVIRKLEYEVQNQNQNSASNQNQGNEEKETKRQEAKEHKISSKEPEKTTEEMAAMIADKKIAVIGFDQGNIIQRFKKCGIENVTYYEKYAKDYGKQDVGIVLIDMVKHPVMTSFENWFASINAPVIHFSGTNIEKMIRDIYSVTMCQSAGLPA